jgi:hypothetical protein
MNGLIIKKHWIDLIFSGEKTWEIRGKNAKARGKIALIQSGSGLIMGTCNVLNSIELTREQYQASEHYHQIPLKEGFEMPYERTYAWVIENAIRFETPVTYVHPQGAVIWVKLEDRLVS